MLRFAVPTNYIPGTVADMKYINMGSKQVSAIGLGTWQFGEPGWGWGQELDYQEAERIIDRALELGINFFDTAAVYGNGRSEEILGQALKGRRGEVVIATKVAPPLGPDFVKRAAEQSLERLGIEDVDLYQLHVPDGRMPISATMHAMRQLMDAGQVHQVGVSNFSLDQWQEAEAALGRPVISNQVQYHLLERRQGRGLLPYAHEQERIVIGFSPLAQGLLGGKYGPGNVPQDLRANFGIFSMDNLKRAPAVLEVISEVGEHYGATPAQVALAWLLLDRQVMVIPGARSVAQLESNAAAADLQLTPGDAERIEQVSRV